MKFYKLVSVCTALILSCSSTIFNFKADANARIIHPISFANRLQVNMSNCKAYYSPTYANSYGEKTMRAANAWASHKNLAFTMRWSRVLSSSGATVQCSFYRNANDNAIAKTTFFYNSISTYPTSSDWNMCKIQLNLAYDVQTDTITHEFGHVFGLDENNDTPSSIMCQKGYGRTATYPSDTDIIMLNGSYPNA